uniref:OVATE domain-containing protein n=1 Tax=Davidia involucrata TaxID=16924 RepID=A0A5B7BJ96_DAVIN
MLLRKTIQQTKIFFHKTIQGVKSFLYGGYHMLPKAPPLKPFSSNNSNPEMQQLDQFYRDFSEQWECDHDKVMMGKKKNAMSAKELMKEEHIFVKNKHEKRGKEEKKVGSFHEVRSGEPCSQSANGGGYLLAQKMKELEMMNMTDADHVLDIEEVLHHYSCLTSPVYLDIVDKFFMDMYSEFSLPQPSLSVNNSMRRQPSVSLNNSMRRLGPLKL